MSGTDWRQRVDFKPKKKKTKKKNYKDGAGINRKKTEIMQEALF